MLKIHDIQFLLFKLQYSFSTKFCWGNTVTMIACFCKQPALGRLPLIFALVHVLITHVQSSRDYYNKKCLNKRHQESVEEAGDLTINEL